MRTVCAALEVVLGRHDPEVDLEAQKLLLDLVEEVGLDGVLDDRVAVLVDAGAVCGELLWRHVAKVAG